MKNIISIICERQGLTTKYKVFENCEHEYLTINGFVTYLECKKCGDKKI
jgi:hypothetical protein